MAYRKLLTKLTYDELKRIYDETLKIENAISDGYHDYKLSPSIVLTAENEDGVAYKVNIEKNGKLIYTVFGESFRETISALEAFVIGIKS